MPINHFKNNRIKIQQAIRDYQFLMPLAGSTKEIVEKSNESRGGTLKKVTIKEIPWREKNPVSFLLELEANGTPFSNPPGYGTGENAFFIFSDTCLYVILIEMKSNMRAAKIKEIRKKMVGTIGRISAFLTHYLLDIDEYDNYEIKFFTIVAYNKDGLTEEVARNPVLISSEADKDIFSVFVRERNEIYLDDSMKIKQKIQIVFKMDPNESESFELDLREIFSNDKNFLKANYSKKTLP